MKSGLDSRQRVFIARQPVLDASGQVFGYELLYRSSADTLTCDENGDLAAARVLSDSVLSIGLDTLTGGHRAFINVTRHILLNGFATLLAPNSVVLEILEDTKVDEQVVEACRALQARGYGLALDDFAPGMPTEALLPFVRFVKVDVLTTSEHDWRVIRHMAGPRATLVAEKVESAEVFEHSRAAGFELFQGYYFCRPKTFAAGAVSSRRLAYARLLAALNAPNITLSTIEDLIKHDASLSFRVLRCTNSAAFGLRREIRSIREALVLLGLEQVRKWASIWTLAGLNQGASPELVTVAILRARCCELLGDEADGSNTGSEFFLLGLCSLIDAMLGLPLEEALNQLPLSESVRGALLGEKNFARAVLDAVIAYEQGTWDEASQIAVHAGFSSDRLPVAYADALKWARELTNTAAA